MGRIAVILAMVLGLSHMPDVAAQEGRDRTCAGCGLKAEAKWKYCPMDGLSLAMSEALLKGEIVDFKKEPTLAGLKVEIASFRLGKLKFRHGRKEADQECDEESGILKVRFTNVTEVKKIDYRTPNLDSWGGRAELEDEFGNKYSMLTRGGSRFWDSIEGVKLTDKLPLNPEMSAEDFFEFEPPVKRATRFILTLQGKTWGTERELKIGFTRDLK